MHLEVWHACPGEGAMHRALLVLHPFSSSCSEGPTEQAHRGRKLRRAHVCVLRVLLILGAAAGACGGQQHGQA